MAETIAATSALNGLLKPDGRRSAGVVIRELRDVAQLQVIARKGHDAVLASRIAKHLGRKSPLRPLEGASANGLFVAATGPGEFWVLAEGRAARRAMKAVVGIVGDSASVFDQSHGRSVVRLEGAKAVEVLAKGTPLDLREPEFPPLGAAHTMIAHIPALIARRRENAFNLSVARSYAGSFSAWLRETGQEFS